MELGLTNLAMMDYPGRVIVVGKLRDGESVCVYAITGRSPSSRARRLKIAEDGNIFTEPTDIETLRTGNPALLVYPAVVFSPAGLALSNGAQTRILEENLKKEEALATAPGALIRESFAKTHLLEGIDLTLYEPDAPNYTPRISAVVTSRGAAIASVRKGQLGKIEVVTSIFDVSEIGPGRGKLMTTYSGQNTNPLPSFTGEPVDLELPFDSPADLAEAIYEALGPGSLKLADDDLRVSVAVALPFVEGESRAVIINRADRESAS